MAYVRKTRDLYEIHVNYGDGWEYETTEYSRKEARALLRDYREACPQYPAKIVQTRERIES